MTSSPCTLHRSDIPSPAPATPPTAPPPLPGTAPGGRPAPVLRLHPTRYCYTGDASPSTPGGITVIYKDLIADEQRTGQVSADVVAALSQGSDCRILSNCTTPLKKLTDALHTTSSPASSPPPWPNAHPATPASASPIPGNSPTRQAPT